MPSISLGKIAFTWKGVYSAATTYAKQDIVSYNGTTYVCLADGTIAQTPALLTAYWQQFAQGVGTVTASAGQIVYNNGSGLVALPVGTTGQVLTVNSSGLPVWATPDVRSGSKVLRMAENTYKTQQQCYRHYGAIMTDLSVRMWGVNNSYVLGDGTTLARSYPGRVGFGPDFPGAKKLFLTYNTTQFVIDVNDKLWAWGYNAHGQIGDNTTTVRQAPYFVSNDPLNSIFGKSVSSMALACGVQDVTSSMALCTDGTVHMTGYAGYGQLGQGNTTSLSKYTLVPNLSTFPIVKIAQGRENYGAAYAVNSNGQLYTWGYNGDGQLGDGTTTNRSIPTITTAGALSGKFVYDIVGGYQTAFAICRSTTATTTGTYASGGASGASTITLAAIGSVAVGHIVTGTGIPGLSITQGPVTVTAISGNQITLSAPLTAQAAGTYNFFIGGILVGWGTNTTYGNLGDGTFANQFTPVQIFASGIAEVFNGNYDYPVACVRKTDNTWWVAGAGAYGANLDIAAANRSTWVQITHASITGANYITKVVKSGTGSYNWMAALLVDGTVLSWGYNGNGALGIGNTTNQVGIINRVLVNQAGRKVTDIFAFNQSSEQTLGMLMDDGSIYLVGYGGSYCNTDDRAQGVYVPFPVIM
jgi:alpha-tubulin suppressor-like RCC1 family protein